MKSNFLILLSLLSLSATAEAGLFTYTVYTTNGIEAECGDYLGKTASGGAIKLSDFLIRNASFTNNCALESARSVKTTNGSVAGLDGNLSCIAAPRIDSYGTAYAYDAASRSNFSQLNQELFSASQMISSLQGNARVMNLSLNLAKKSVEISASADTTVILTSLDTDVEFYMVGIKLTGGVSAKNIIWNFPNAQRLFIAYSGMDPNSEGGRDQNGTGIGIPGTVIAPQAEVVFNNALITGALYAKSILSKSPTPNSAEYGKANCEITGIYAGQVNPTCLETNIPGLGCRPYTPPTPTPLPPVNPPCNPEQQQQQGGCPPEQQHRHF